MRVSDTPICMICYSPKVSSEYLLKQGEGEPMGMLALCQPCENCLRRGDRAALFAKLDERNRRDDRPGQRASEDEYRAVINETLDRVYAAMLEAEREAKKDAN